MRIHYTQHVPFENLGYIKIWLTEHGHTTTVTQVWQSVDFPVMDDFDVLIILGGPMGADEEEQYNWLASEKTFIQNAISAEKKIIGICLGAQLLAAVLGAKVYVNEQQEIGWFPLRFHPSFSEWMGAEMPAEMIVFHWHGDTYDLPDGAINHATSEACLNQLFTFGNHIIGIQFHPEVTAQALESMVTNEKEELTAAAPFIQPAEVILQEHRYLKRANELMEKILENICR